MTETPSLAALRLIRGHLKGSLTKLVKFTESIGDKVSLVDLDVRLSKANSLWEEFNASQTSMYEFAEQEDYVDPLPEYEDFETKYLTVKSVLISSIREREKYEHSRDAIGKLAEQQKILLETLGKSQPSESKSDFFLPKIHIEPFGGEYHEWPSFRDMFTSAVHDKTNLSSIQKFLFLKSCLRNTALSLLSHLPLTNATYDEAWDRLVKRYDRPRHIINAYIKSFMELPNTSVANVNQLRKISNGADEIVRGLTAINSLSRDPWIIYILLNKLDAETRKAWSEDSVTVEKPTIDEFLDFLERRCDALESAHTNGRENQKPRNSGVKSMHASSPSCMKCRGSHGLAKCPDFLGMNINFRRDFVKSNKVCFNCLRPGHPSNRCLSKFRCSVCKSRHHSLVHDDSVYVNHNANRPANTSVSNSFDDGTVREFIPQTNSNAPSTSNAFLINNHSANVAHNIPQTLLPTAIGKVQDIHGVYQEVRILIDSGSQVSFVTESCAQRLGLKRRNARIPISGIGSSSAGKSRGLLSLIIASCCDLFRISVDAYILSCVTSNLPSTSFNVEDWDHLHRLTLADPSFNRSSSVDILLGSDKAWEILLGSVVYSTQGYPIAQKTIFGWVMAGQLPSVNETNIVSHHATLDVDTILQAFWTIEEVDPKSISSKEDQEIEDHFLRTHSRDSSGKYIVDLPFKAPPKFANSFNGAFSRLKSMERKFASNKTFFESYSSFLEEYFALGHMTKIPSSEINKPNVFYLPHHAVLKPDSTTTKLRVVFDGSFKDSNAQCLNDSLMIGPPIQRNLFAVCLRFRRHQFVFTADIVKMFRQIWVSDKDSDFQRIVWRKSPTEPLEHFRLRTVTYGTSCAPYLSVRVLGQLAIDYKEEFPIASEIVLNDFYVDDVVSGADTISEALFKRNSLIELLLKCGFELSKWESNCKELLPNTNTTSGPNISLDTDADSWIKVLGLYWNSKCDMFSFRLNYTANEPITKRQILRDVARIFDPLGFLAPSVVSFKILFQELWHKKLGWDEEIPGVISNKWSCYRSELSILTKINIPRTIGIAKASFQLHGFSDASASAYAAVIYSRYQSADGNYVTNIVASKSRVAPLKVLSIPRLELCAALLLSRLIVAVQQALNITFSDVYAWSDSTVVLSWLSSPPRRWNIFVGNRTSEILNTIPRSRWFPVRSECNPADCASRGIPPSQLLEHPLWWTGPHWLRKGCEHWPIVMDVEDDLSCKVEEKKSSPLPSYLATYVDHPFELLSSRISSWNILIRTVAQINRVIDRCRKIKNTSPRFTPNEIFSAKTRIIKWLQGRFFGDDIRFYKKHGFFSNNCKLTDLSPFLDNFNILRVGGRIEQANISYNAKHPIILPKEHIITKLILVDSHIRFLHPGVSTLFALIRQEYWVIGCRNLLRKITHDCMNCFRQRKATISQHMGNLPPQRISTSRPFAHCGCDYAGPLTIKTKSGRKTTLSKGYISLFVCLASKAIHLELVSDLTSDAFLAAFRRFVARRGKPSHMYSDNGTNFRGAARCLSEMHHLVLSEQHNSIVAESLARDGISWHFNPPSAPHFGGLWEAGVKSVKQHLRRVIGTDCLTFEQLYTLLTQIEAILNSRPLCQLSESDLDPLTPAHFFLGETYAAVPEPTLDVPVNRLSCWQLLQSKIQGYWKRWQAEYVTSLQNRPRWQQIQTNIKLNDLVVIKEANLPPGKWAMGRVVEVHPGKDGHVRVVTLKTSSGNILRPIHKLAILPVC